MEQHYRVQLESLIPTALFEDYKYELNRPESKDCKDIKMYELVSTISVKETQIKATIIPDHQYRDVDLRDQHQTLSADWYFLMICIA